ncbi:MAG TPA: serine/threonine-protein kinase [Gaiellales bacterium]|nr:serine/threonine-protein kinase [Gaiellales bacterium]
MVVGSSGRWYNLPLTGDVVTGSVVGPYRLAGPLGRGGMGVVYVADDLRLGRRVAVKVVAPQLSADAQFRARFLRESRLAASLDHPNIIPVYEAGEVDGTLYLVMRYVEGRDLKELLARDGRLDPARAVRLVAQVASALDAAHARGLIHRDVKPGNILLGRGPDGDHAYLCDFGLTKNLSR